MQYLRLKLPNIDRVGLVMDISNCLAGRHINIISMEVELNTIYLEIEWLTEAYSQVIMEYLHKIPGITDVIKIDLMPHQEKEEQLKAVLTSVSDGIVAIDNQGIITQYNPAAEKILNVPAQHAFGKYITDVLPSCINILEILQNGTIFNNREVVFERTGSHYLVSGRPIIGNSGEIRGAVAILKDISDVREMVRKVTGQLTLTFDEILYTSTAMQRTVAMAKSYARGDSTVLIRGETGTGKELFARALHAASPRSDNVLVPVNCAAIPDALLESELFGYEKGAFTGANKSKQGLFEIANGGTIFLDEIGELSAHLQAKLLRALQENRVRRIGGALEIPVDVRILAATNRNLEEMMKSGRFREDLYYRLNVIPLFIPPLRDRREDIPILAEFFLRRFAAKLHKKLQTISETALDKLKQYHWPGNIRELENVIERAVNIAEGPILLTDDIILDQHYAVQPKMSSGNQRTLEEILNATEREVLLETMRRCRTSRQIGAALGLSHTAVLKKLRKYGLREQSSIGND